MSVVYAMSGLVTDTTLAAARSILERLHVTDATHCTLTESVSATGAVSQSWALVGTVKCRVETDMGRNRQMSVNGVEPAQRPVYDYTVYAAHDVTIKTGDRLTLASGITLSVQQDSRNQSQNMVAAFGCTEVTS